LYYIAIYAMKKTAPKAPKAPQKQDFAGYILDKMRRDTAPGNASRYKYAGRVVSFDRLSKDPAVFAAWLARAERAGTVKAAGKKYEVGRGDVERLKEAAPGIKGNKAAFDLLKKYEKETLVPPPPKPPKQSVFYRICEDVPLWQGFELVRVFENDLQGEGYSRAPGFDMPGSFVGGSDKVMTAEAFVWEDEKEYTIEIEIKDIA